MHWVSDHVKTLSFISSLYPNLQKSCKIGFSKYFDKVAGTRSDVMSDSVLYSWWNVADLRLYCDSLWVCLYSVPVQLYTGSAVCLYALITNVCNFRFLSVIFVVSFNQGCFLFIERVSVVYWKETDLFLKWLLPHSQPSLAWFCTCSVL